MITRLKSQRDRLSLRLSLGIGGALGALACSLDDPVASNAASPVGLGSGERLVAFSKGGQLAGGMLGRAWFTAGSSAVVRSPKPCDEHRCFEDVSHGLCAAGKMPALQCASPESWDCEYGENWGVLVALSPGLDGANWGPKAPKTFALKYEGKGDFYLAAHVAGDPKDKIYCVSGYTSGTAVKAEELHSECWTAGGTPLPSFSVIDSIGLRQSPKKREVDFDFCVTQVSLDAPTDAGNVFIGDTGKLSGALNGWAWVASGDLVTVGSPSPCNDSGCFNDTGGRLCTSGSMPAVECPDGVLNSDCNWDKNWGVTIGFNPGEAHRRWGASAKGSIAVAYSGRPAEYRLHAHLAGDPEEKQYCVRGYRPGQSVAPEDFQTECWTGSGQKLDSFARVDAFHLALPSTYYAMDFDYCVERILVK